MRARISKRTVDKLQPGEAIADIDVNGFSARCLPSGTICYDLRYRTSTGERRRLSLGLHGTVTPTKLDQSPRSALTIWRKTATRP